MYPFFMKHLRLLLLLFTLHSSLFIPAAAKTDAQNAREAKALFDKVYNLVFGPAGSSLEYDVNIIGVYKTHGTIIYKGEKIQYQEKRYCAWEDGTTAYMVDKQKRLVKIYRFDDDEKDEYLSKFKYDINNFLFSYATKGDYYEITAKVRGAKFFGIRSVTALVHRKTLHPVSLRIKLSIFSTTVKISNFKAGGISDTAFRFPRSRFPDYKYEDMRKSK